ncbi:TPA: preprotein translocase subunit YajC, partial [Mannheimia haemolytica]|nr:preprotein translocase subunit YajC [Mannheimia haemolytica]
YQLLVNKICFICGKKDCPQMKKSKDYKDFLDALEKGDVDKADKIYNTKFSQFSKSFGHEMEKNLEKNRIPPIYQGVPFDSFDLYQHYSYGNGEALNLSSVGLSNKIRPLVNKDKAFGKSNGSIESRFISQYKNEGRTSFSNAYDFTKEASGIADPLWALGTATISGELKDIQIFPGGIARGNIHYSIRDRFTDPFDTFNFTKGEWNPNGTPYIIQDSWIKSVRFSIDKKIKITP